MPDPKGPAPKDSNGDSDGGIDTKLVRKLAGILSDTGLTEIEVEKGGLKIRVSRQSPAGVTYAAAPAPLAAPAPAAVANTPGAAGAPASAPRARGEEIKSPMVGTAYLSPQPGADAFIKVGDKVTAGQTLLIVEAMKTMNPIPSPRAGTVLEILVGDASPVEFGEPLIVLE